MTILNMGTYPPKQCGIATFSMDLRNSLLLQGHKVQVMTVSDDDSAYRYPDEVVHNLKQNQKQDYVRAAAFINTSPHIQLLIIQHEYGIYGGEDGEYILELVKLLHKPFILITHTVLPRPSKRQKQILNDLCQRAAGIVCMTKLSSQLLIDLYEAPPELITVIAHGVPEFKRYPQNKLKQKHSLQGCELISTFGLIGPGKGLELGIRAMAEIVPRHPSVRYLILGQTHPMLQKYEGEKYRQMLINLVSELDIKDNVIFINKFLSDKELGEYLYMTDIYLSPYPNMDQAVSGTMAFAMGCGRAIVSTPYAYASEVLMNGRGLLSRHASPQELASLMEKILNDKQVQKELQDKAFEVGKTWTWPNVGKQYSRFFKQILSDRTEQEESRLSYAEL
ncbi:MAG: glycosyl transferase family 1 [Firmicutes bacterium HGW-Firmicutes-15]|nr:MAG: glycosyl transferase family 1 [Firmicutes bacterium HGW-Firmicutes-15]